MDQPAAQREPDLQWVPTAREVAQLPENLCPSCRRVPTYGVLCGPCELDARERALAPERILAQLDGLGINVPARGRFTFAQVCAMVPAGAAAAQRFIDDVVRAGRYEGVRGLLLEGPTGVGKSLLACAIVRELIERRALSPNEIRYDTSRGIWGLIRAGYGDGTATHELTKRMRARLWVLDDLGAEHPTEDAGQNLTEILTARELKPTVATMNLPRDVQGDRWDATVWDRIKSRLGDRNFEVVRIVGRDHRLEVPAA